MQSQTTPVGPRAILNIRILDNNKGKHALAKPSTSAANLHRDEGGFLAGLRARPSTGTLLCFETNNALQITFLQSSISIHCTLLNHTPEVRNSCAITLPKFRYRVETRGALHAPPRRHIPYVFSCILNTSRAAGSESHLLEFPDQSLHSTAVTDGQEEEGADRWVLHSKVRALCLIMSQSQQLPVLQSQPRPQCPGKVTLRPKNTLCKSASITDNRKGQAVGAQHGLRA